MEELKRIFFKMGETFVQVTREGEHLVMLDGFIAKHKGCFAHNNGKICFVDEAIYVAPYTRNAMRALRNAGYREDYFYVPFSNGDTPNDSFRWGQVIEEARKQNIADFEKDAAIAVAEKGVKILPAATLQACFKMPGYGVEVIMHGEHDWIYPQIERTFLSGSDAKKLGTYTSNNGVTIFVASDGNTYVAPSSIQDILRDAGYRETYDMFVPFSNAERICDSNLDRRWREVRNAS